MTKYPNIPQPFVLRLGLSEPTTVEEGGEWTFGIRLFGPAIEFYPYVVLAVTRVGERGLGRDRTAFELLDVTDGSESLIAQSSLKAPRQRSLHKDDESPSQVSHRLKIRFETPMRLQTNGTMNVQPSMSDLIRAAIRRVRVLSHFYGPSEIVPDDVGNTVAAAEATKVTARQTRWHEIHRRSTRQQVDMCLSGLVGCLGVDMPDDRLVPWLHAASVCHVGKATSFGYGRIELDWEET
ncbi:MAG TPA: CRISPR system precrRNA processing endoribonuclease RAMP protein Cas6 [Phycisphaerae bacterium]|nr:CRISPR system precrRNA processing endoribonuclease RAMP protein Cas6 [Phycisphaerae bacterium]